MKIKKLDAFTSNRIAAGEVVERPVSIVKELVENALDAQATSIAVEIRGGGIELIRVTDNGSGIEADDALIAFERHATSKISVPADLDAIETLGFRGEALSSIAAVAQVELTTRVPNSENGTFVRIHGGEPLAQMPTGCPEGTTMNVQNVFFNTPARLKFLKKPHIEAGYIGDYLSRMILARPDVSFKYSNNGQLVYHSAGDRNLVAAIHTVYGRDLISSLRQVDHAAQPIRITGYIGGSDIAKPNRNAQSFFVNGRYIRSARLSGALQEAFGTRLMGGQFPFCVINVSVPFDAVDVNIHPNKLDVRFREESAVCNALAEAVRIALGEKRAESADRFIKAVETAQKKDLPLQKEIQSTLFRSSVPLSGKASSTPSPASSDERPNESGAQPIEMKKPQKIIVPIDDSHIRMLSAQMMQTEQPKEAVVVRERDRAESAPVFSSLREPYSVIGQAFASYLLVQQGESLYFIDQHAAHERMLYDKLMDTLAPMATQHLLSAERLQLTGEEYSQIREHTALIRSFGFEISIEDEPFLLLRAVPYVLGQAEGRAFLISAAQTLAETGKAETRALLREKIALASCKAAVKANTPLSKGQLEALLNRFDELGELNCPHGRPIVVRMQKKDLEKLFRRIV